MRVNVTSDVLITARGKFTSSLVVMVDVAHFWAMDGTVSSKHS